jgi:predicted Zn-dependent protease
MEKLEPPDTHYVLAAIGWLELGNPMEARAELDQVQPLQKKNPDVLDVRWELAAREKKWDEALHYARELIHAAPDRSSGWLHQSYALRRIPDGSVRKAWEALLPVFDRFPKEPLVSYNLSCYACQLRQLEAARVWLKRALVIGGKEKYKRMALQDEDLQELWDEIREF